MRGLLGITAFKATPPQTRAAPAPAPALQAGSGEAYLQKSSQTIPSADFWEGKNSESARVIELTSDIPKVKHLLA
jgi:hypothetical protein